MIENMGSHELSTEFLENEKCYWEWLSGVLSQIINDPGSYRMFVTWMFIFS